MRYAIEVHSLLLSSESTQFAADLVRAYSRWCDRHLLRVSIVRDVEAEFGFKEAILLVEGDASALLRENGCHRKLAYSEFEAKKRIQTSTCQVHCYQLKEDQVSVKFDIHRAGAGGAVYRPDLMTATSDRGETLTFDITRNRIEEAKESAIAIFSSRTEPSRDVARTWRFHPANQFYVKDLTGYGFSTQSDAARFFDGEF